jgi:subtilase family serine protease
LNDTAHVWVYQGGDTTTNTFIDIFNQILSDGHARVMSTSFGCAEINCWQLSDMQTVHNTFNMMVGEGWSLVAAAGDNGAVATVPNSNGVQQCQHFDSVVFPGSDSDVVSAGGTTLSLLPNGSYVSEVAWTGGGGWGRVQRRLGPPGVSDKQGLPVG